MLTQWEGLDDGSVHTNKDDHAAGRTDDWNAFVSDGQGDSI